MSKTFQTATEDTIGNNLLIIDGFNLAFRWKHSRTYNFAVEYLQTVMSFANSYKASRVVILSDGGADFRNNIFPLYKSDRKEKRKTQSEEDAQEFQKFMDGWTQAMELLSDHYMTIQYKGVEADDIAAVIATNIDVVDHYDHIWLLSSDKDWDLLVDDNISRFSYRTRKETTLDNWSEQYPYIPDEHLSVKVLQGDKSDSIPGCAGIGEKRAAALVREYGTAYDLYDNLPIENDKRVFIQNLNAFKEQILLNYELMDLESYCWDAILPQKNGQDLSSKIGEILT